ncbi:hypothetical protein MJK72_02045 [Klebsiella pneumoniae]|nr:hypothetical protein MJK72_02045 [Klebsiella pneumoniae]
MVIQEELGEHRFSHGRFDDAARLMEQITTSDELIDFLIIAGLPPAGLIARWCCPPFSPSPPMSLGSQEIRRSICT